MAAPGTASACTWQPRGELPRLQRHLDLLRELYPAGVIIVLPPDAEDGLLETTNALPGVTASRSQVWSAGRHEAVSTALKTPASHIHYSDLDRLLHWIEAYPGELIRTLDAIQQSEGCFVLGRTARAWDTHPRAMVETEAIFNQLFSYLAGQEMDFGAGSRGFSREAAAYILANDPPPASTYAVDAGWMIRLKRGSFPLHHIEVEGLEWETPDQYRDHIATPKECRQAALAADGDPVFWQTRVGIAERIIHSGLEALADIADIRRVLDRNSPDAF